MEPKDSRSRRLRHPCLCPQADCKWQKPVQHIIREYIVGGCPSPFYSCSWPTNVNLLPYTTKTNRWFCYQSVAKRLTPKTVNFLLEFSALSWSPCRPMKTRAMCIDCNSVPLIIFLKNCLWLSKCGNHLSLFSLILCMSVCVYL